MDLIGKYCTQGHVDFFAKIYLVRFTNYSSIYSNLISLLKNEHRSKIITYILYTIKK